MTNNQLAENSVNQLLNSVRLARDNAEREDNRVDHSFYFALTIALEEPQERRKAAMDSEPVAGEARFKEERPRWTPCTAEHVSMVLANPEDWPNYEVRYLYAAPQPAPVVSSEPVAYTDERNLGYIDRGRETAYLWGKQNSEASDVALYRHAQQPVGHIPVLYKGAELLSRSGLELIRDGVSFATDLESACMAEALLASAQPAPVVPEEVTSEDCPALVKYDVTEVDEAWARGFNACRAAMLQAGNSPVIPDTWIPVSERLPEEGGRYWCYVEEQNSLGKSHYQWNCSWNGEIWGGAMMHGRVTHWMPLPAAPQEVKGE